MYLTAEPQPPEVPPIPQGILQSSIKIANEPPQTLKANLQRAWANFNQDKLDSSMKANEFKTILFTLSVFHALVLGRRKFGTQVIESVCAMCAMCYVCYILSGSVYGIGRDGRETTASTMAILPLVATCCSTTLRYIGDLVVS